MQTILISAKLLVMNNLQNNKNKPTFFRLFSTFFFFFSFCSLFFRFLFYIANMNAISAPKTLSEMLSNTTLSRTLDVLHPVFHVHSVLFERGGNTKLNRICIWYIFGNGVAVMLAGPTQLFEYFTSIFRLRSLSLSLSVLCFCMFCYFLFADVFGRLGALTLWLGLVRGLLSGRHEPYN